MAGTGRYLAEKNTVLIAISREKPYTDSKIGKGIYGGFRWTI